MRAEPAAKTATTVALILAVSLGAFTFVLFLLGAFNAPSCDVYSCPGGLGTGEKVGIGLACFDALLFALIGSFWFWVWVIRTAVGDRL